MKSRALDVEDTRRRILDAVVEASARELVSEIRLEDVADQAGVSVRTVLRHFGTRADLLSAASEHGAAVVGAERRGPVGDVAGGVRLLLDHYEKRGDATILLLAQENSEPTVAEVVQRGRQVHRDWVRETFAPQLEEWTGSERELRLDLLVVATDVYTWKILSRDQGLSRPKVSARIRALVESILSRSN